VVSLDGEAAVVITKRSEDLATHKGEWVFPGGSVEAADRTPGDAAIRETAEELGVTRDRITLIGEMDGYGPIPTGHVVHVFIGLLEGLDFHPADFEVADVEIVRLSAFLQPGRHLQHVGWPDDYEPAPSPDVRQMIASSVQSFFEVRPGQLLWGSQSGIVIQLLDLLLGRPDWRA
jgi:8-oxo-dGTP pyrophosphatase MutT (NUDIX family)